MDGLWSTLKNLSKEPLALENGPALLAKYEGLRVFFDSMYVEESVT